MSIKFKSNEEGKCPICNSQMLEYFGMELEDTAVYFPWHCPDCDTDGKEWYYVNFSEVRDNNDTVGETEGICPNCGGEIEYGTAEPEGNSLGYEYFCSECGGSGIEWYDLDFDSQTVDGYENEDIIMESKQLTEADDEGYYAGYADSHKDVLNKLMSLWQLKKNKDGSKFVLDCSGKKVEIYKPEGDKKYSLFLDDKWYMEDNLATLKRMGINFYLGQTAKADVEKTFKDNDIPLDDTKTESKEIKTESTSYTDLVRAGEDLWRDGAVVKGTNVDGIYDCYTAGHGGYLVDTDVHPELAKYGEETYIPNIVGFEEDYEALKIIWAYPEVLSGKVQLNSDWYNKLTLDDVLRYDSSLNDDFRKEFPDKRPIPSLSELRGKKTEATDVLKLSDKMKEIDIPKKDDDVDGDKTVDVNGKYGPMKSIKVNKDNLHVTPSIARQINKENKQIKTEAEMDIADMYADYEKAYHKELDVKRVPCVIARDTMMSGWGMAEGKNHYQVVLCADSMEARNIEYTMQSRAKDEGLANIRVSFGIQLPRNASVSYNVGRYASAWNMGDSWYERYDPPAEKKEEDLTTNYGGQNLEKPVAQVKKDFQNLIDTYNAKVDKKVERNGAENEVEYINKTVSASGKKAFLIRFQLNEIGGLLTGGYEIIYRGTFIDLNTLDTKEYAYGRIEYKLNDKNELEAPVQEYDTIDEFISKINDTNVDELLTEAINTQDIQSHTTAGDTDEERAYYGKNMTKRDKVRSLDQAKRNLDKANNGDDKINARQVMDQVSYDNLPSFEMDAYKYNKDLAKKAKARGDEFWEKEHNDTAKQFADDIKMKHLANKLNKKQEARNPANDEVNTMIRSALNGSTKYVKNLEDLGFVLDKYGPDGKVNSMHYKDGDRYLYRGKLRRYDKDADLYNYLTKERPTSWEEQLKNGGTEAQKYMSSEKDIADNGYKGYALGPADLGKAIPKRFKTGKSTMNITEPYGSEKIKKYKDITANIASKKDDIKDSQDDLNNLNSDETTIQNNINKTQSEIDQLEKDKKVLVNNQKTEAISQDVYNRIKNEPRSENYNKGLKIRDEIVTAWKNNDLETAYAKWDELHSLFSNGYDDEGNQTADWSEEQSLRDMIELTSITDTIEDKCVYDVTDYGKEKAYKEMGY